MTKGDLRGDAYIDSRDVIARIEELESELADAIDDASNCVEDGEEFDPDKWAEKGFADYDELEALRALAAEASGSPDWAHGETLIREDRLEEYARQLAEDCDMLPREHRWPFNCIDWEEAANELRLDYFDVDFDGITYFIRS
jgi:hypothetical protein